MRPEYDGYPPFLVKNLYCVHVDLGKFYEYNVDDKLQFLYRINDLYFVNSRWRVLSEANSYDRYRKKDFTARCVDVEISRDLPS